MVYPYTPGSGRYVNPSCEKPLQSYLLLTTSCMEIIILCVCSAIQHATSAQIRNTDFECRIWRSLFLRESTILYTFQLFPRRESPQYYFQTIHILQMKPDGIFSVVQFFPSLALQFFTVPWFPFGKSTYVLFLDSVAIIMEMVINDMFYLFGWDLIWPPLTGFLSCVILLLSSE